MGLAPYPRQCDVAHFSNQARIQGTCLGVQWLHPQQILKNLVGKTAFLAFSVCLEEYFHGYNSEIPVIKTGSILYFALKYLRTQKIKTLKYQILY